METLLDYDRSLFYFLNAVFTNPVFDAVMPFVTDKANFLEIILLSWFAIFTLTGVKGRKTALILLVIVLISDQTTNLLKELFHRIRPCTALSDVRLLVGCGDSYSFPSNHATNIFATMLYLSYKYRMLSPLFIAIALTVAYSRVYVGVHYPLDITGGAVLGAGISFVAVTAERKLLPEQKMRGTD
ncbi:MAG: hypothetical protein A2073_03050 [Deltaproteobacteria bacterium GWC2_42_11]|nr:MAG: hypothetical protein A2073_03050 [Deltaproteobacteria bacterium GWC2_42_11]